MTPTAESGTPRIRNFGRNLSFRPRERLCPENEPELLSMLNRVKGSRIRVAGRLHSWSPQVETDDILLSLEAFDSVSVMGDTEPPCVRVGGGCTLDRLLTELRRKGWTLPTLGVICRQTVAGAVATATHGSGSRCLSAFVRRVRLAHYHPETGEPTLSEISKGEALNAAQCSLGCLGVMTEIDLEIRPAYRIEEHFRNYPDLQSALQAEAEYPLQQLFWFPWSWTFQAQHRKPTEAPPGRLRFLYRAYRFLCIDLSLHFMVRRLTGFLGTRWMTHCFYREFAPRSLIRGLKVVDQAESMLLARHDLFRHLEIEFFVPRSRLEPALNRVRNLLECADRDQAGASPPCPHRYTHHYPICIRRVEPDDTHLSMAQSGEEDSFSISLMSYDRSETGIRRFQEVAAWMAPLLIREVGARCHWGKINPTPAHELERLYPRLSDFQARRQEMDPEGRFLNRHLDALFGNQHTGTCGS